MLETERGEDGIWDIKEIRNIVVQVVLATELEGSQVHLVKQFSKAC